MNVFKRLSTATAAAALLGSIGFANAQTAPTTPSATTTSPTTTAPVSANDSARKDGNPTQSQQGMTGTSSTSGSPGTMGTMGTTGTSPTTPSATTTAPRTTAPVTGNDSSRKDGTPVQQSGSTTGTTGCAFGSTPAQNWLSWSGRARLDSIDSGREEPSATADDGG